MNKITQYLLYISVVATPLIFSSSFSNFYDIPKIAVLAFSVSAALLFFALRTLLSGRLKLSVSNFDVPIIILALSYLVSAIIKTPNKMEAFLFPGTTTVILAGTFLFFILGWSGISKKAVAACLFVSATLAGAVSLLAISGILAKIPQLPAFVKDASFSPIGGLLPQAIFLGLVLPLGIALLFSERQPTKKLFYGVSLAVVALSLALSVYNLLPGKPLSPALSGFDTSWAVSTETLKQSPLLGIGPGNYLTAFNRFRPISYNATNLWAVRFTSARDFVLTLVSEVGLLGLAAFILLVWQVVLTLKRELPGLKINLETLDSGIAFSLALAVISLFVFPANIALIVATYVILFLAAKSHEVSLNLLAAGESASSRLPAAVVTLPFIAGILAFGYFGGRVVAAEVTFKNALDALGRNEGKLTYDTMRQAIALNPYVDRYHSSYAQVNLALARSLAQKKDLTDADRTTVAQLIQQAIREGKATVTLNPQRSGSWELLARTYQSVMSFAQGADNFTIQSFDQAVALDPINPNLRIALGGVYYALGKYDDAVKVFELAVLSKPDLANAHYNLAAAYREKGEIDKAIAQINAVLSLVSKDSKDYEVAKAELDNLEKKRPAAETSEGENLTPPAEAEKPVIKPPLTLPEEATPPASNP